MTFSVNIGLPTETTSYPLGGSVSYLYDMLNRLEDNTDKLVNPDDIRDSIFSLHTSTSFKQTTASGSTITYIGLDSGNPDDRDVKEKKIYFGKRAYSGTYSYSDSYNIMNDSLLSSDVDIFLYNTRIDTDSQASTRLGIIAGTNLSLHTISPYIQSQLISGTTQSLSMDIVNPSGNIVLESIYSGYTGSVIVNNMIFPTSDESMASASNDKILFLDGEELIWDYMKLPVPDYIGETGSQLDIYGTPTNVNGYPIEFADSRMCPVQIGDILYGDTFNNMPLSETLRRLIYNYLPPTCDIRIIGAYSSGYAEVGTYPTPNLQFTINKKTLPTLITGLVNMIPGSYPAISSTSYTSITSNSNGIVMSPVLASSTEFKVNVNDGVGSGSASTTLTGIYPYFYGFSNNLTMNSIGLASLSKLVEPIGDKTVDITGSGNLYFIYDFDYGTLSNIYDNYGNTSSASFSHSSIVLSSPTGLWAAKEFYVYQWDSVSQMGPPSVNYQFNY